MLGISVYLSDLDIEYIDFAAELGVKYIFTSLHIPEEDLSDLDDTLPVFLELARKHKMSIIPDISPYTFEKLGLSNNDFTGLRNLGFDTVRLDFGFEDVTLVAEISNYFQVILNASLVDEVYLKNLLEIDFSFDNLLLMHNFYPRQDTGLNETYFSKINETHQKYKLRTMAFVVGDKIKRLPLYEGLPTLEKHRNINPYVAGVELMIQYDIEMIFIGDNQAHRNSLNYLNDFMMHKVLTVPVILDDAYAYLYDNPIGIRQDETESIIRLAIPRQADIPIVSNNSRARGNIIIDNTLAGRYSGEVQIVINDLPFSSRSNNIGFVHPDYLGILDYLNRDVKLKFVRI